MENNENECLQASSKEDASAMLNKKAYRKGLFIGIGGTLLIMLVICTVIITITCYAKIMRRAKTASSDIKSVDTIVDKSVEEKVGVLEDTINEYYLEDVQSATLEEGMYRGILESLEDPYSVYYTAQELQELQQETQGIYYGVGAYVSMDLTTGYAQFSKIMKDTPAEESGLMAGDYIYMVNDEDMHGQELSYVVSKIKGEEGTKVKLTLLREGASQPLEVEVERRKVESPTVNLEMYDNQVAYIQITEFDTVTESQFKKAYQDAQNQGMKGLIIDLRSNPGGNLTTVVDIARQLLPKGLIVYTEDKYGERVEYSCDGTHQIEVPLVVLVNGYSASASEILSGAIKDYGIGTLIGTTTYGKGIVQKVISLSDGSAVKLTVSKYFTPNGNNIHKIGIEPDIEVEFDAERYQKDQYDNQLEEAKKVIAEKLK